MKTLVHIILAMVSVLAGLFMAFGMESLLKHQDALATSGILYVAPRGDCADFTPCFEKIQDAINASSIGDTIKVAQGVYTSTSFEVVNITKPITLTGGYTITDWANSFPLTQPTIIDAENQPRHRGIVIQPTDSSIVTLQGLTIQNGYAENANGGGIYVITNTHPTILIEDSRILSNTTQGDRAQGGGIFMDSGTLVVRNSLVSGNSARSNAPWGQGGGIFFANGNIDMEDSMIIDNQAWYYGGGMVISDSHVTMKTNSVLGNSSNYGGGIHMESGTLILNENLFQENNANGSGAVIDCYDVVGSITDNIFISNTAESAGVAQTWDSYLEISKNTFKANYAYVNGGVMRIGNGSDLVITENDIVSNQANSGGVIFIDAGNINMDSNNIIANSAKDNGGAIYVQGGEMLLFANQILSNSATNGGAIFIERSEGITVSDNLFSNNHAQNIGGAIMVQDNTSTVFPQYNISSTITMSANKIISNVAETYGSALAILGGSLRAQNDIIADNPVALEGIYVSYGSLRAYHWTLVNNGDYAITTNNGTVMITNTIVAYQQIGGFIGNNIVANYILTDNYESVCGSGALCDNIIEGAPRFVDPTSWDYHIRIDSDAIDQGIPVQVNKDIDGDGRPLRSGYDLGADEFPGEPIASFTSTSPDNLGDITQFTNTSLTGGTTKYIWAFGDGVVSTIENPIHMYTDIGIFNVTLVVSNAYGVDESTGYVIIHVENYLPAILKSVSK